MSVTATLRSGGRLRRRALVAIAVVLGLALAWLLLGQVTLSPDARYELAWGVQLAHGHVPGFADPSVSTPHPLPLALATALAPLGQGAAVDLYSLATIAGFGMLLYAAFRLGRALGGPWAGALALVLVATRPRIIFFAAHGFVDVPFAAFVLLAAALAAERRDGRSWTALALLGVAGLLRPEVWGVSILYGAWLAWGFRDDAVRVRNVSLAAAGALAGPVVWIAFDLVFSGDPFLSVSGTRERGAEQSLPTGISHLLPELRHAFGAMVGRPLAVAGVLAAVWALVASGALGGALAAARARGGSPAPAADAGTAGREGGRGPDAGVDRPHATSGAPEVVPWIVAVTLALGGVVGFGVLAVAGLPLNDRYVIVPALALVLLTAGVLPHARRAPVAALVLVVAVVGVVVTAPGDIRDAEGTLARARDKHRADDDLERLLGRRDVRAELRRCRGVVVAGTARPDAAAALDRDPADVSRARGPLPDAGYAAFSTSDSVDPRAPRATRLGAWTFVTRC